MPNRTIYVADADVSIFEKAQQLAGGNLSATIASALRRYVENEEARAAGFEEITVKVGKVARSYKRFRGRLLARGKLLEQNDTREVSYSVYQTIKGKLAVYVKDSPNWNYWSDPRRWKEGDRDWNWDWDWDQDKSQRGRHREHAFRQWSYRSRAQGDWSPWPTNDYDFRLDVYDTLEELNGKVPQELYEAVVQALKGDPDGVEFLDI